MKKFNRKKTFQLIAAFFVAFFLLTAESCGGGTDTSKAQNDSQTLTNDYTNAATQTVKYPLSEMKKGGWLERRLLKENLLRQNDANRIAYVTLLTDQGQPIVQYTIQGMVFSLNSQMTTSQVINRKCDAGCDSGVTDAAGDNGTWGPEPEGISFFTTEGVQIKWNGKYVESDSPLNLTTKPLIVYDASTAKAPENASGVKSAADGGINTGS